MRVPLMVLLLYTIWGRDGIFWSKKIEAFRVEQPGEEWTNIDRLAAHQIGVFYPFRSAYEVDTHGLLINANEKVARLSSGDFVVLVYADGSVESYRLTETLELTMPIEESQDPRGRFWFDGELRTASDVFDYVYRRPKGIGAGERLVLQTCTQEHQARFFAIGVRSDVPQNRWTWKITEFGR